MDVEVKRKEEINLNKRDRIAGYYKAKILFSTHYSRNSDIFRMNLQEFSSHKYK